MLCPQWGDGHWEEALSLPHLWHSLGHAVWDAKYPKSSHYCLREDRHFRQFPIYLRLPVKVVKKQLWLLHSIDCWEDFCVFQQWRQLWLWLVEWYTFLGDTFSNLWLGLNDICAGVLRISPTFRPGVNKDAFREIRNKTPGCFCSLGEQCARDILA